MLSTPSPTQVPVRLDNLPENLLHCAHHLSKTSGDDVALTLIEPDTTRQFTYAECFDAAAQYARALEKAGVQPHDLVVLVLQHGEDVLFAFWGAILLGAIPSIMPFLTPKLDAERYYSTVRELVELSAVKAVVTYPGIQPALKQTLTGIDTLAAIINVNDLEPEGQLANYIDHTTLRHNDIAFLQHSSGSTGLQKGVMLSHGAVLNQIAAYSRAIGLTRDDVIVSWLPLYHDMGLIAGFTMPIVQGVHLVLMSPFHWLRDPLLLFRAVEAYQGTLCWLPNFAYNYMATRVRPPARAGLNLSSLRATINCSEPVRDDSHKAFYAFYEDCGLTPAALQTCYAMAENTFAVTQSQPGAAPTVDIIDRDRMLERHIAQPADATDAPTLRMVSCGKPIPNTKIRIVDADRQPIPERHVGEIALRSDCMLSGYYHREEETTRALEGAWFYTGDLGYIADGELYITGRQKDLIIVGGKNLYPQDIEAIMNEVPGVHPGRTVAFGVWNEALGTEDLAAIAEAETDAEGERKAIVKAIRMRIAQSTDATARYVQVVGPRWLLKTSSGKIARGANRDKFLREILGQQEAAHRSE